MGGACRSVRLRRQVSEIMVLVILVWSVGNDCVRVESRPGVFDKRRTFGTVDLPLYDLCDLRGSFTPATACAPTACTKVIANHVKPVSSSQMQQIFGALCISGTSFFVFAMTGVERFSCIWYDSKGQCSTLVWYKICSLHSVIVVVGISQPPPA